MNKDSVIRFYSTPHYLSIKLIIHKYIKTKKIQNASYLSDGFQHNGAAIWLRIYL